VTVLLVGHDGERWLEAVLDALAGQTRPPDRVVAVDTGSVDATPRRLRDRLGDRAVLAASPTSGYGEAVALGLAALPDPDADDWVWLLHDDSAPPLTRSSSCWPPPRPTPPSRFWAPSFASGRPCAGCSRSG
jgi:GT2 family glycosyltransferase